MMGQTLDCLATQNPKAEKQIIAPQIKHHFKPKVPDYQHKTPSLSLGLYFSFENKPQISCLVTSKLPKIPKYWDAGEFDFVRKIQQGGLDM